MTFDYSKLRGLVRERGKTQESLASVAGMKEATFSQKINNNSEFKQSEIIKICEVLKIPHDLIHYYFFTPEVQKS